MHSALYEGTVTHVRSGTPTHRFAYPLAMCYLDLDEIDLVLDQHPLWSRGRGFPVQYRRSDYLGDPGVPLARSVRATLAEAGDGIGPIRLLTHLRTWGWCFNPISLYYCFDAGGTSLRSVVASVTNTPWRERYDYVLDADTHGAVDQRVGKSLHVSPFLDMNAEHRFVTRPPGEALGCTVENYQAGRRVLQAVLLLQRRPLDRGAMTRLLLAHPLMTWRVSARIYVQAARLAVNGAAFHPHPHRQANAGHS